MCSPNVPMRSVLSEDECDRMRLFLASVVKTWDAGNRNLTEFFKKYRGVSCGRQVIVRSKIDTKLCQKLRKQGLTYKAIGKRLGIADETARQHCLAVNRKREPYCTGNTAKL